MIVVSHDLFRFFAIIRKFREEKQLVTVKWELEHENLFAIINEFREDNKKFREEKQLVTFEWEQGSENLDRESPNKISPMQYCENLITKHFPSLDPDGFNKKVKDVRRFFNRAFTSTADATPSLGSTYQWQSSEDNLTFNDIATATGSTYTPTTALNATTYFRRKSIRDIRTTSC